MLCPDVNVLFYAHRVDDPVHPAYERWWKDVVDGPQPFALSVLVAVAFVRIATRLPTAPTPLGIALSFIDEVAAQPNCRLISPGPEHWARTSTLCRATRAMGKQVADAQHAAVAIEHGCTWVTRDPDFAAFGPHGLTWQHLVLDGPP